ncbi:hypothetical protein J3A83DRAFT_4394860 [Scleroderma citrinum]
MTSQSPIPPLLGDGHGKYRIHIVGNSGWSTLGAELASVLDIPYISLDTLFWNPNWVESTPEEFRAKVQQRLAESERGWVVDGNYTSRLGGLIVEKRTDCIWLDPPFLLYFPRLVVRTFLRLIGHVDGCAPGCSETLASIFLPQSILYWAITNHRVLQCRERENMKKWGIHVGGNMRRIGGWGMELKAWKQAVLEMVKRK